MTGVEFMLNVINRPLSTQAAAIKKLNKHSQGI